MSVACRYRVHLLTHPVEGLVVTASLVDAAAVPVDRPRATVVAVIAALRGTWTVATRSRICTGRSEADTEQPRDSDSSCQCRCRQRSLERHFLTPFLVDAAVVATRE
jgi:hypothetical protein